MKKQQTTNLASYRVVSIILNTHLQHESLPVCECGPALDQQSLFQLYNGLWRNYWLHLLSQ